MIRLNDEVTLFYLYLCRLEDNMHLYICVNPDYRKQTPIRIIGLTNDEHTQMQMLDDDVENLLTGGSLHFNKYLKYKYKYLHYIKK